MVSILSALQIWFPPHLIRDHATRRHDGEELGATLGARHHLNTTLQYCIRATCPGLVSEQVPTGHVSPPELGLQNLALGAPPTAGPAHHPHHRHQRLLHLQLGFVSI